MDSELMIYHYGQNVPFAYKKGAATSALWSLGGLVQVPGNVRLTTPAILTYRQGTTNYIKVFTKSYVIPP